MSTQSVKEILNEQCKYLKMNAYKSFDLCDITSQSYFLKMNRWSQGKSYGKYIKYPHNILLDHFTPALRKWYKIEKQDFAQSNAFIVRGLLRLYQHTGSDEYLKEANSLIERVLEQKSPGFEFSAWGQPYDWFSKKIIPAYTPRTTVTSQVGKMFLDAYAITNDSTYLRHARDIGDFLLKEMPLSFNEKNKTCYSYTTIDTHQVHNPNMMAGGFLALLSHHTNEEKYADRAVTAVNFTFAEMNPDGSWFYAKLPNNQPSKIDNYHTGYNIEGAILMQKYLGKKFRFTEELTKSIEYYQRNLFSDEGIPYLTNKKKYPVDIQCCGQSIITRLFLSEFDKNQFKQAENLFNWTVDNMYAGGSYYYRISKNGSKDKTDYIRWGDAWMLFAGSLLLTYKHD